MQNDIKQTRDVGVVSGDDSEARSRDQLALSQFLRKKENALATIIQAVDPSIVLHGTGPITVLPTVTGGVI